MRYDGGADFVKWNCNYVGTSTSLTAMPVSTGSTTYFSGNTGYSSFSGTAYTTGTTWVPMTIAHHWYGYEAEFTAIFWRVIVGDHRMGGVLLGKRWFAKSGARRQKR